MLKSKKYALWGALIPLAPLLCFATFLLISSATSGSPHSGAGIGVAFFFGFIALLVGALGYMVGYFVGLKKDNQDLKDHKINSTVAIIILILVLLLIIFNIKIIINFIASY